MKIRLLLQLRALHRFAGPQLMSPTEADVRAFEHRHALRLPPNYRTFIMELGLLNPGGIALLRLNHPHVPYLDLETQLIDTHLQGLPGHQLPFARDDDRYYCFDMRTTGPEQQVVSWSPETASPEPRWCDFEQWVEQCWIPSARR